MSFKMNLTRQQILFWASLSLILVLVKATKLHLASESHTPDTPPPFDRFWASIHRIEHHRNGQFTQIAAQLEQIAIQLNESSSPCMEILKLTFRSGLEKEWSAKLLTANAFTPGALVNTLLGEQFTSTGNYHGCLAAATAGVTESTALGNVTFSSQYCFARLTTPQMDFYSKDVEEAKWRHLKKRSFLEEGSQNWLLMRNRYPLALGLCAPSICTNEQLAEYLGKYFADYLGGIDLQVDFCQMANDHPSRPLRSFAFTLAASILLLVLALSFLASFIRCTMSRLRSFSISNRPTPATTFPSSSLFHQFLKCFDISCNYNRLLTDNSRKTRKGPLDLTFIYGLKAYMMLMTMVSHSGLNLFAFSKLSVFSPFPSFMNALGSTVQNVFIFSPNGIDVYFMVSAFLVTNSYLSKHQATPPSFLSYVFRRWFRLVPSVVAILCLTIVAQRLGSGPLFHQQLTDPFVRPCTEYWWTHLLFINNFWTFDKMCNPALWYIAADFQLHILFYPIIRLYYKRSHRRHIYLAALLLASSVYVFFATYVTYFWSSPRIRLDTLIFFNDPNLFETIRLLYTNCAPHILAYVVGIIIAIKVQNQEKLPAETTSSSLQMMLIIVVILGLMKTLRDVVLYEGNLKILQAVLPFAFLYSLTILAMGRFSYLFLLWNRSPFHRFLSRPLSVHLGRLSYGFYLTNFLVIWFIGLQALDTQRLSAPQLVTGVAWTYGLCYFLSLLLYVFFEGPFGQLAELISKKGDANLVLKGELQKKPGQSHSHSIQQTVKLQLENCRL